MKYSSVSVRQLKRKGKPWQARVRYKEGDKWKETSKILTNATGKRQALQMGKEWMDELNKVSESEPSSTKEKTIGEVIGEYLEYQYSMGELERSTFSRQKNQLRNYIQPYIGENEFSTFNRDGIQQWLIQLNKRGLAQDTIANAFAVLKKTYNFYYARDMVGVLPFLGIKPPKRKPRTSHLDENETADLVEALSVLPTNSPLFLGISIAFYTGIRRGEICGLKWRNYDTKAQTLTIENSIGLEDGVPYTKQPKNSSSIRKVPVVSQLGKILADARASQNSPKTAFILTGTTAFMNPDLLGQEVHRWVQTYSLTDAYDKPLTLHLLRHNFGFVALQGGIDIVSLSRLMGHSETQTTLRVYTDTSKAVLDEAVDKLEKKFDEGDKKIESI